MPVVEFKLEYTAVGECALDTAALIVAAGSSTRMGGTNKQLLSIDGIPVIARTMLAFERSDAVKSIVVVARRQDMNEIQLLAEKWNISKLTDITEGGKTRFASVLNGLSRLKDDVNYVLIHDGARPLVSGEIIKSVADAAHKTGAAACGIPVKDTLKRAADGNILGTVSREGLVRIQTPQGFDIDQYREAAKACLISAEITDDCAVMEAAGHTVTLVDGSERNIKITSPEDVAVAEALLRTGGIDR